MLQEQLAAHYDAKDNLEKITGITDTDAEPDLLPNPGKVLKAIAE